MVEYSVDELEIFEMTRFLSLLMNIDEPISIERAERMEDIDLDAFLHVGMDNFMEAFKRLESSNLSEHQKDLFEFIRRVKTCHNRWMTIDEPWEIFDSPEAKAELGREDPKKMLRVNFGPMSIGEELPMIEAVTLNQLREKISDLEKDDPNEMKPWVDYLIGMLELDFITKDEIVVCYADTEMMIKHGIPYDRVLSLSRRN